MTGPEPAEAVRAGDRAHGPAINYQALYAEYARAGRCRMTWVMDLASYKAMRRSLPVQPDDEEDEDKWVPGRDDQLFRLPILVRDGGGEPHIEWTLPEDGQ